MRKMISLGLAALLAVSMLAGCGQKPDSSAALESDISAAASVSAEEESVDFEEYVLIDVECFGHGLVATACEGEELRFYGDMAGAGTMVDAPKGTQVTLAAREVEGWTFVHWMQDGAVVSTEPEYIITAEEDTAYTAVFTNPQAEEEAKLDVSTLKTMGEVFNLMTQVEVGSASSNDKYIYAFMIGDTVWRVVADLTEEESEAILKLDYSQDDADQQIHEILGPIAITGCDRISDYVPAQEEINAWVGKTGQDMLDAGWECYFYDNDSDRFYMSDGMFGFFVVFEDTPHVDVDGDFSEIKELTVSSLEYDSIINPTNLNYELK